MSELLRDKLIPAPSLLIEDTRFQDWLLKVGLMKRTKTWQEIQPVWKNGGTDEILTDGEWVVMDKLLANKGYIVAHSWIAPLSSKNFIKYSQIYVDRIRRKLENPELIFSARYGYGYGLGIERVGLGGPQQGRLLYRLWQDLGILVPLSELALGVYGYTDSYEYDAIGVCVGKLRRKVLVSTGATILSYPQIPPPGGYKLIETNTPGGCPRLTPRV